MNGTQSGPFSQSEVQSKFWAGEIQANHLAWRPGLPGWSPVGSLFPPPLPGGAGAPSAGTAAFPAVGTVRASGGSSAWKWVVGVLVGGIALIAGVTALIAVTVMRRGTDEVSYRPIMEDRAGHKPVWRKSSFEAAGPADEPEDGVFTLVRYRAPGGQLAAYLTPDPKDGKRHPAVVWAHGGFGGIGSHFWEPAGKRNDQSARAIREKGIVLMCPSWRGENDNPGRFELFYGEVDDLLAAVRHVKSLPYVDPERVYLAGHSTGGTLVLLAAGADDSVRAVFSLGGMLDGVGTLSGEGYGNTPYSTVSVKDHRLRSPMRYAAHLRCPVFYFEGSEYFEDGETAVMEKRSKGRFQAFELPGDHWDIVFPVTGMIAEKILADTGETCGITFTKGELVQRYNEVFATSLARLLADWRRDGGDLEELLSKAGDDSHPRTREDLLAVVAEVARLGGADASAESAAAAFPVLADLRHTIERDALIESFDELVGDRMTEWARGWLGRESEVTEKEADGVLALLASLAGNGRPSSADLVVTASGNARLASRHGWSGVFETFDADHPQTGRVMAAMGGALPDGLTGVLLLDAANDLSYNGWKGKHPFDSEDGRKRLENWIQSTDPGESSFAHSAAFGSAFVGESVRSAIVPLAMAHADRLVRLEGAWSDLKAGGTIGLPHLQEACLDVHQSARACSYLKELDHEDKIPEGAREPAFAAKAALARWLQHPNELGSDPLSLEIYDSRVLQWPPAGDQRTMWLVKFTYRFKDHPEPKTAYGCVGGMTWSSFEEYAEPPTPESLYLHHCTLEMQRKPRANEKELSTPEARRMALEALKSGNPGVFDGVSADESEP